MILPPPKSYSRILACGAVPRILLSNEITMLRFFNNVRHIVSELLFYQLFVCAAATASNIFALESNGILSARALGAVYDLTAVLALTFIYCYLSESMSLHLNGIGDIFYEMAWHRLPTKAQKLLILAIQHSQQEYRLKGLGFVDCSLFVFGKVGDMWAIEPLDKAIIFILFYICCSTY